MRHINTNTDSEILLNILANELENNRKDTSEPPNLKPKDLFKAVEGLHNRCSGGYAVVGMIAGYGLFAFRDPNGIRPLVFGKNDSEENFSWGISSESVALNSLGFDNVTDLAPGEAMFIDNNGKMSKKQCSNNTKLSPCIFEYVYFGIAILGTKF